MKIAFLCAVVVVAVHGFGGHVKKDGEVDVLAGTGVEAKSSNTCIDAGPQSPRDVTSGSVGDMKSNANPKESTDGLVHVNTHFHLGAEHRSTGEFDELMENNGFACKTTTSSLEQKHLASYDFQYCTHVEVGQTYEFHWVYSSGGEKLGAGLGGAFATTSSPEIVVQGQTFVVVNDDTGAYDRTLVDGSTFGGLAKDVAMYMGSTTGPSYNNKDSCSPYSINWHVDRKCQLVSAKSMDAMCKEKKSIGLEDDTHPHGSRELVSRDLSVDKLFSKN